MKPFFNMPLWLSIPLALIYLTVWVGFFVILYRYRRK